MVVLASSTVSLLFFTPSHQHREDRDGLDTELGPGNTEREMVYRCCLGRNSGMCGGGGPMIRTSESSSHRDAERVLSVLGAQGESIPSTGVRWGRGVGERFLKETLYCLDAGSVCFGRRVNTRSKTQDEEQGDVRSCAKGSVGRTQNVK